MASQIGLEANGARSRARSGSARSHPENLELIGVSEIKPQTSNLRNWHSELSNPGLYIFNPRSVLVGILLTWQVKPKRRKSKLIKIISYSH
jgi:hypothetical protein